VGPGYLKVCYDRKQVRDVPSIGTDGELRAADEEAIFKHYGLTYEPGAARAYWAAEARRPVKSADGQGRAAGTLLDAAAAAMARGASGVWLRAVSRLGLACRGTVYLLVGYLAFRLALAAHGRGGAPASSAGAVQAAIAPAWGRVPLVLLVAGLGAYAR